VGEREILSLLGWEPELRQRRARDLVAQTHEYCRSMVPGRMKVSRHRRFSLWKAQRDFDGLLP